RVYPATGYSLLRARVTGNAHHPISPRKLLLGQNLIAEIALEDLAGRVPRQFFVPEPDLDGDFERREAVAHVLLELLLRGRRPWLQLHDGCNFLSQHFVRDPEDRAVGDGRVLEQRSLDFGRRDVLA